MQNAPVESVTALFGIRRLNVHDHTVVNLTTGEETERVFARIEAKAWAEVWTAHVADAAPVLGWHIAHDRLAWRPVPQ